MKNLVCKAVAAVGLALSALSGFGAGPSVEPNRYEPLPAGSIVPTGWLGEQLGQMTEGLAGRLYERSDFLKDDNGWLVKTGVVGKVGWEEQAYWLRSFAKLAVLTRDRRLLDETAKWMVALAANADADGWYGPSVLKAGRLKDGRIVSDIWPHMVMNEAVLTWWEYTGDGRWLDLVHRFLRWCGEQDDVRLIPPVDRMRQSGFPAIAPDYYGNWTWDIQYIRAGDLLAAVYRVYDVTRDEALPKLARRVYEKRVRPGLFLDDHNVCFAQSFAYGTTFGRQSRSPADLASADHWYDLTMSAWGSMVPRQGFCADESTRIGCYDPRYGTETCAWAEFVRSFSLLGAQTGATKWADRAEDVVFNWVPIAYSHGWKGLHYITAANQVNQDAQDHDYSNGGAQAAYSATGYRCCRHNGALALPEFAQHLVLREGDGLVFWTYAPHEGRAVIGGRTVRWRMETRYPFEDEVRLTVSGAEGLKLRFRVPGWTEGASVAADGRTADGFGAGAVCDLPVSSDGRWTLGFPSRPTFRHVVRTRSVMVEKGPLTYSVALAPVERRILRMKQGSVPIEKKANFDEKTDPGEKGEEMVEIVPAPGSRWNFALETSVAPEFRRRQWNDDCFSFATAPCELFVKARELPVWQLQDGQPSALQDSPAFTESPLETVRFIPMACARSHVTVFPTATTNREEGIVWTSLPSSTLRKDRRKAGGLR